MKKKLFITLFFLFPLWGSGGLWGGGLFAQNLSVCAGKGFTLTNTAPAQVMAPPVSYTWYEDGKPLTSSNAATYHISGKQAGTYHYVRKAFSTDCPDGVPSNTFTVVVNALPEAPTSPSSNVRCGSGAVTFSATAPASCTIDWYNAAAGGSTVATSTTSYAPSLSTTTSYYAQARNNTTGCVSTSRTAVTGAVVTVPSTPSAPSQNGPKCAGEGITFSATATSGATGLDWTGSVSGQGSSKTTTITAGNYSAQVRAYTTAAGTTCYSGYSGSTSGTVVTVPSTPGAPSQNGPKCAGEEITFTASLPSSATGLDWTGTGISGTGTSKTTTATAGNYSAQVRAYTTAAGITCYSAYTTPVAAIIDARPDAPTVSLSAASVCDGTELTFNVTGGAQNYIWGGDMSNCVMNQTPCRTWTASRPSPPGLYTATVYNRSYSHVECWSLLPGSATGQIVAKGAKGAALPQPCGCESGTEEYDGKCRRISIESGVLAYVIWGHYNYRNGCYIQPVPREWSWSVCDGYEESNGYFCAWQFNTAMVFNTESASWECGLPGTKEVTYISIDPED
jgi:hypothetical protein